MARIHKQGIVVAPTLQFDRGLFLLDTGEERLRITALDDSSSVLRKLKEGYTVKLSYKPVTLHHAVINVLCDWEIVSKKIVREKALAR